MRNETDVVDRRLLIIYGFVFYEGQVVFCSIVKKGKLILSADGVSTPVLSPAETLSHVWLSEVSCYNIQFTYKSSRTESLYSMVTATYESMLQTSLREDTSLTKDKLEK